MFYELYILFNTIYFVYTIKIANFVMPIEKRRRTMKYCRVRSVYASETAVIID